MGLEEPGGASNQLGGAWRGLQSAWRDLEEPGGASIQLGGAWRILEKPPISLEEPGGDGALFASCSGRWDQSDNSVRLWEPPIWIQDIVMIFRAEALARMIPIVHYRPSTLG